VPESHPPSPLEFRAEAVRLARDGGRPPDKLAQVLGRPTGRLALDAGLLALVSAPIGARILVRL
jgi:hypothetical protein